MTFFDKAYLKDSKFLKQFDRLKVKEQYAKVTILDENENPFTEIQGEIVNGGNVNIDGKSALRRTCNFTMINRTFAYKTSTVSNQLAIGRKIGLEVGFKNTTTKYPEVDIFWFPQGIFVINSASVSNNTSGLSISLSLKDKMCLLNGDRGGTFPATVTLSKVDIYYPDGTKETTYPTLYRIIYELVTEFGHELPHKVIINDIDEKIKKVMRWNGNRPLYRYRITTESDIQPESDLGWVIATELPSLEHGQTIESYVYPIGADIGYIYTDFIYPAASGELVGEANSAVTAALDKIKNILGNFEYFYDIEGNFVFQEIKNYLNSEPPTLTAPSTQDNYLINQSSGKSVYTFEDAELISTFQNAPQYGAIKNDITIWGKRTTASGAEVPIRYHLAIDKKPKTGNIYDCYFYTDESDGLVKVKIPEKVNSNSDPSDPIEGVVYLYADNSLKMYQNRVFKDLSIDNYKQIKTTDWRSELYLQGIKKANSGKATYDPYFTELESEWPRMYNLAAKQLSSGIWIGEYYPESQDMTNLDYYLDFIDLEDSISDFSIAAMGRLVKIIEDDDINCLFASEIPNFVFIETKMGEEEGDTSVEAMRDFCERQGQPYIQVSEELVSHFLEGGKANSAFDLMCSSLHEFTSYNENVTINAIPIYHLEPNTRITLNDYDSDIYGDFMIKSISLPIGLTGTMSIQCQRALERY